VCCAHSWLYWDFAIEGRYFLQRAVGSLRLFVIRSLAAVDFQWVRGLIPRWPAFRSSFALDVRIGDYALIGEPARGSRTEGRLRGVIPTIARNGVSMSDLACLPVQGSGLAGHSGGVISETTPQGHHGRRCERTVLQNRRFVEKKDDRWHAVPAHVIAFERRTYPVLIKLHLSKRSAIVDEAAQLWGLTNYRSGRGR
jgi:hypothetical protein